MIRVELGEEIDGPGADAGKRHGKWFWRVAGTSLQGYSRTPLLSLPPASSNASALLRRTRR
jgi:hypothetical protein